MTGRTALILALTAAGFIAGCGEETSGPAVSAERWSGVIYDSTFTPPMLHKFFFNLSDNTEYSVEDSVSFSSVHTPVESGTWSENGQTITFSPVVCYDYVPGVGMDTVTCGGAFTATEEGVVMKVAAFRTYGPVALQKQ